MKYLKSPALCATAVVTLLLAALAPASYGQNLLINGDFEMGPPKDYNYTLSNYAGGGWNRSFDPTYWSMVTTRDPAPPGSALNSIWVPQGEFAVRRTMFSGQGAGTKLTMESVNYQMSSFAGVLEEGSVVSLSFLGRAFGAADRFSVYATISFFDASNTVIEVAETTRVLSNTSSAPWTELSTTVEIPVGTAYFKVTGVIDVAQGLTATSYVGFDDFKLQVVPEPGTVALFGAAAAAGFVLLRRRKHS